MSEPARPKSCKFQPLAQVSTLLCPFSRFISAGWEKVAGAQFHVQTRRGSEGRRLPFTFCNTVRPLRGRPVNSPQIDGRCNFCLCWSPDWKADDPGCRPGSSHMGRNPNWEPGQMERCFPFKPFIKLPKNVLLTFLPQVNAGRAILCRYEGETCDHLSVWEYTTHDRSRGRRIFNSAHRPPADCSPLSASNREQIHGVSPPHGLPRSLWPSICMGDGFRFSQVAIVAVQSAHSN